jgi:MOSC domain-containing protein YiiM
VLLGNVYRVGTATVAVTQPRVPCYKLGIKMGAATFPKRFLQSGWTGFYLRVVEEGDVGAGDAVELVERPADGLTVRGLWHLVHHEPDNVDGARQALRHRTLGPEWREPLEERVARA